MSAPFRRKMRRARAFRPLRFTRGRRTAAVARERPVGNLLCRTLNVGKSSLINALTGTEIDSIEHPGRTRELNFFDLGNG